MEQLTTDVNDLKHARGQDPPIEPRVDVGGELPRRIVDDPNDDHGDLGELRQRRVERRLDDDVNSIKLKLPTFKGSSDPEYIEWDTSMEAIFNCHNYTEEKKVKLAVVEFYNYASQS